MVITVSKTKSFTPEFNGNRGLPPNEQIAVVIKNPTVAMREKLMPTPQMKGRTTANGTSDGLDIVITPPSKRQILQEMVVSVVNCAFEENGVEKNVRDASDLLNAPSEFNGLVDEVFAECQKELQKSVPEKN